MTEEEKRAKRVALAKDVLAQLDAKKFIAAHSGYFFPKFQNDTCGVCALGAMVVACCGVPQADPLTPYTFMLPQMVSECLSPLFDEDELGLIEAAFEGGTDYPFAQRLVESDAGFDSPVDDAIMMFGEREDGDEDEAGEETRIRGIMQNIIDNDGEFCP